MALGDMAQWWPWRCWESDCPWWSWRTFPTWVILWWTHKVIQVCECSLVTLDHLLICVSLEQALLHILGPASHRCNHRQAWDWERWGKGYKKKKTNKTKKNPNRNEQKITVTTRYRNTMKKFDSKVGTQIRGAKASRAQGDHFSALLHRKENPL